MKTHGPGALEPLDRFVRRGLLLVAAAAALTGVLAGLARLGWSLAWGPSLALQHGPLLVVGVFGTVIALERAVALGRGWAFVAPAFGAATAAALLLRAPWAASVSVMAGLSLSLVNAALVRRQAAAFTWLMLAGSALLSLGSAAWARGAPVSSAVPSWLAFFVLTIVSERLELSRLAPTPRAARHLLVACCAGLALACLLDLLEVSGARRALGGAMVLIALWQLRYDLGRRMLRNPGLPRYAALGVLAGALWLLPSGLLLTIATVPPVGPLYDAVLHGVFVGYVLSMVFAHAPIILPAVARVAVPFSRLFYLPLVVLHAGLVLRVAGDLLDVSAWRQLGALTNALALATFPMSIIAARARTRNSKSPIPHEDSDSSPRMPS